ncbi:MAG: BrnT family toxin [Patescibacteria group bacterium]
MKSNIIPEPLEFEWDSGNIDKNKKRGVSNEEAEEVFLNNPLIFEDLGHSRTEKRYQCLGETDKSRKLFVSFTVRGSRLRIISVRSMSKKERKKYEETK